MEAEKPQPRYEVTIIDELCPKNNCHKKFSYIFEALACIAEIYGAEAIEEDFEELVSYAPIKFKSRYNSNVTVQIS